MRNLHKDVTDRILAQLDKGALPWRKPWSTRPAIGADGAAILMPRNAATGRAYSGINILLLWGRMDDGEFTDSRFLTFKQAKELGGTVRKGEKGCEIIFVSFLERDDKRNPDKTARIPFLKSYYVFNVQQCDGLPEKITGAANPIDRPAIKRNERDATIDEFIASTRARIVHGEPRAFYRPGPAFSPFADLVNMPVFDTFESSDRYYATLFHELGHWTGAEHRLNRTFGKRFGDRAYAAEELVAELTSAFACAEFGIDNDGQDTAYLATWLRELLTQHDKAIVTAAAAASKAVEFMRGLASAESFEAAGELLEAA